MTYVSREYYGSLYGEIAEDDFNRQITRAQIRLDTASHGRVSAFMDGYDQDTATAYQKRVYRQIQSTVCDLIHSMLMLESTGMGDGISSVSNDGYSESYKITTAAEKETQLSCIIREGLSGTGMTGAL